MIPPALRGRLTFQFQSLCQGAAPTVPWLAGVTQRRLMHYKCLMYCNHRTRGSFVILTFIFKCQTSDSGTAAGGAVCPIPVIYCSSPSRSKSGNVFMTQRVRLGLISTNLNRWGYFGAQHLKERSGFGSDGVFFPFSSGKCDFLSQAVYLYSFITVGRINIIFPSLHYHSLITFSAYSFFFFPS